MLRKVRVQYIKKKGDSVCMCIYIYTYKYTHISTCTPPHTSLYGKYLSIYIMLFKCTVVYQLLTICLHVFQSLKIVWGTKFLHVDIFTSYLYIFHKVRIYICIQISTSKNVYASMQYFLYMLMFYYKQCSKSYKPPPEKKSRSQTFLMWEVYNKF